MSGSILVAASTKKRSRQIANALEPLGRDVDSIVGTRAPADSYRLIICEVGGRLTDPRPIWQNQHRSAHVVLMLPELDVHSVSEWMLESRVNHILRSDCGMNDIRSTAEKLASGAIFGMERILPAETNLGYRRLKSYAERCKVLDEFEEVLKKKRLRGRLRADACTVAEELLMNAMYQAPVDAAGDRLFEGVSPKGRVRRRTPRPVSLRYAVHAKKVYICVRDRYGSLPRDTLVDYLYRCSSENQQIERKALGAGLGLYLVASMASRMWINVLPGVVTEVICVLQTTKTVAERLEFFSFTAQRSAIT